MTINFLHFQSPRSPVSVAITAEQQEETVYDHGKSSTAARKVVPEEEKPRTKKSVRFFPQVQVYGRLVDEEEAAMHHSVLHYTQSEFRDIRREIHDIKQIYNQKEHTSNFACVLQNMLSESDYCIRGVEHIISPDLKDRREKRRQNIWFIAADLQERAFFDEEQQRRGGSEYHHQQPSSVYSSFSSWTTSSEDDTSYGGSSSWSSSSSVNIDEVLGRMIRAETKQSAVEAVRQGQSDANTANQVYNEAAADKNNDEGANTLVTTTKLTTTTRSTPPFRQNKPRSILRKVSPSKEYGPHGRSPLALPAAFYQLI